MARSDISHLALSIESDLSEMKSENVKGSDFWQLHKLFDEVAERAAEWVDELAERVTALGGYATGTVRMAAGASTLPEFPTDITKGMDCRCADTYLCFLEAHLQD